MTVNGDPVPDGLADEAAIKADVRAVELPATGAAATATAAAKPAGTGPAAETAGGIAGRVFATLPGRWVLNRVIEPGLGTATGVATFAEAGSGRLHYREDVELRLATGHVGDAYREYEYVLEPDGRIRVLLADGATMHLLSFDLEGTDPAGPVWSAADVHDCLADQYRGTYRLDQQGVLKVDMKVDGPAKDYRIVTEYRRDQPPS
ncbi:DUF6314 family protein [Kineosporia babensis]|uniref:DUF6314 family protein n=1 Tax=Kineosporia babensis TaxID=499548 RepID=A0A9X1NF24_9ACTN|nr:DUF6314 family protein [Kineosporia babensis]